MDMTIAPVAGMAVEFLVLGYIFLQDLKLQA